MRLLLASNSAQHERGFLDHLVDEIDALFAGVGTVLFVPFAIADREAYVARVRARFAALGREVVAARSDAAGPRLVESAEAIFVGGGNTFRLLKTLHEARLLAPIAERVRAGMPYLGASAGTNVACPTIRTTNDMPIVEPPSLDAMGLVSFQINPHFFDADPASTHMGETREQRLAEFLDENDCVVVGLYEGSWIRLEGGHARLGGAEGARGARIFRRGAEAEARAPGAALDDLLRSS